MAGALAKRHEVLSTGENFEYGQAEMRVWLELADDVPRILSSLRRTDLAAFFSSFGERVGEAASACDDFGAAPEEFGDVLDALDGMLRDLAKYGDWTELEKGALQLSERDDRLALAAYQDMLAGWRPDDDVARRSRTLRRTLERQRSFRVQRRA